MYSFYRNGKQIGNDQLSADDVLACIAGNDPRETFTIIFHRIDENGMRHDDVYCNALDLTGMLTTY